MHTIRYIRDRLDTAWGLYTLFRGWGDGRLRALRDALALDRSAAAIAREDR